MRRMVIAAAFAALVASSGSIALAQGQGKGKGKGTTADSTAPVVSLVLVSDYNSNGQANWGDQVVFSVNSPETTAPQVQVMCFQNGDVVFGAVWPTTPLLTLSSRAWQGGAADCNATAFYFSGNKNETVGSINFRVEG